MLFCLAMITDKIDGDLARKHNLVTNFGKIADPIADKAITGMAFIGLAIIADFMPAWLWWTITVVVLLREWAVTIARLSIAKDVVMPAKQSGKVKTATQALALGGFVAPFGLLTGVWEVPGDIMWWLSAVAMADRRRADPHLRLGVRARRRTSSQRAAGDRAPLTRPRLANRAGLTGNSGGCRPKYRPPASSFPGRPGKPPAQSARSRSR